MAQHHVMPGNPQSHSRQPSSVSPKVSPKMLPHPTKSPKISELHELPRPPANVESLRPSGLVGYSDSNSCSTSSCITDGITNPLATSTTSCYPHSQLFHTLK
nr:unnamed protein product [Digitaria exilis]